MTDSPKSRNASDDQRGTEPTQSKSEAHEPQTQVGSTKARGGEASGHIWVLLVVSTVIAAAALLGVWWFYFG